MIRKYLAEEYGLNKQNTDNYYYSKLRDEINVFNVQFPYISTTFENRKIVSLSKDLHQLAREGDPLNITNEKMLTVQRYVISNNMKQLRNNKNVENITYEHYDHK